MHACVIKNYRQNSMLKILLHAHLRIPILYFLDNHLGIKEVDLSGYEKRCHCILFLFSFYFQVIVGSFIADGKKQSQDVSKTGPSSMLTSSMLNFGAPGMTGSPPSQGGSSESSDENGGSPLNRESGFYGNSAPSIHNNNMQMYQLWTDHTQQ